MEEECLRSLACPRRGLMEDRLSTPPPPPLLGGFGRERGEELWEVRGRHLEIQEAWATYADTCTQHNTHRSNVANLQMLRTPCTSLNWCSSGGGNSGGVLKWKGASTKRFAEDSCAGDPCGSAPCAEKSSNNRSGVSGKDVFTFVHVRFNRCALIKVLRD